MTPDSTPSPQDVLEAYVLEPDNDRATLERYLLEYPQYAEELTELSRELDRPLDYSTAPLDAADCARIDAAWTQVTNTVTAASAGPLLQLDAAKMKVLAHALGVPRQVLSAFREHRVIATTVPRLFGERLAELLGTPYEVLRSSLARAPGLVPKRSYKSTGKPETLSQITFEQLLTDACVPPDKRAALMAEKK